MSNRIFLLILATIFCVASYLVGAPTALASVKCQAQIYAINKNLVEDKLDKDQYRTNLVKFSVDYFSTGVRKRHYREKAAKKALKCATDAYESRSNHRKPDSCKEMVGYDLHSIKYAIERHYEKYADETVEIHLRVSGEKGCGLHKRIMNYKFPEKMVKNRASWDYGYDRPGADYTSFEPAQFAPETCQAECRRDAKCKAWTYVEPAGNKRPRCWLKNSVPPLRKSTCCVSGFKGVEGGAITMGGSYRSISFRAGDGDAAKCLALCQKDGKCLSWTYEYRREPRKIKNPTDEAVCKLQATAEKRQYSWYLYKNTRSGLIRWSGR